MRRPPSMHYTQAMHITRNAAVYAIPDQAYVIVPMVGDGKMPLAIGSNLDAVETMCDRMNEAIGSDMFVVECLFSVQDYGDHQIHRINYTIYRDADKMDWVDKNGKSHG